MFNRLLLATVAIASVVVAPSVEASIFATTTLTFETPINIGAPLNRTFDSLEIDWVTPLMSGFLEVDDLTDLSFSLVDGGTTVYRDDAIVGGVVQPISGIPRFFNDLEFFFNADAIPAGQSLFRNRGDLVGSLGGAGETYDVTGSNTTIMIEAYDNGQIIAFEQRAVTENTTAAGGPSLQWTGSTNALFRSSSAWSPVGPPGINNPALFDQARDYIVNFDQDQATDSFVVQNGNVTFRPVGLLPSNHTYTVNATSTIDNGSLTLVENVGRTFRLNVNGALLVGDSGAAALTVGSNTFLNSGALSVGGSGTGSATVNIQSGGTLNTGTGLTEINATGAINLSGGTLNATTIDHTGGGQFNFTGGRLVVDNFDGDLIQDGGTLAPGDSPGTTTVSGDYTLNAGSLEIEIGGATAGSGHDRVNVTGFATLLGTLDVTLINGFTPLPGDAFTILDIDGTLSGQFIGLDEGDLVGNFAGTELSITYAGGDGNDVALFASAAVPEPSTLLLMTLGLPILRTHRSSRVA